MILHQHVGRVQGLEPGGVAVGKESQPAAETDTGLLDHSVVGDDLSRIFARQSLPPDRPLLPMLAVSSDVRCNIIIVICCASKFEVIILEQLLLEASKYAIEEEEEEEQPRQGKEGGQQ